MREVVDNLARTPLSQVVIFVLVLTILRLSVYPYLRKTLPHKRTGAYGAAKVLNELLDAFVYAGVFVFMLIRPFGVQAFLIPSGSMWPTLYVNDFIVANKAIYRYTDPKANDVVVFRPPKPATENHPEQLDEKGEVKVDFIKRLIGVPGDVIELRKGILYRNGRIAPEDELHRHYSWPLRDPDQPPSSETANFRLLTDAEAAAITKQSFKLVKYHGRLIPLNWSDYDTNSSRPGGTSLSDPPETQPYSVAKEFVIDDQTEAKKLQDLPAEPLPKGYYLMMGDNRNGSFDSRGWGLVPRDSIIGRAEFIWFPFQRIGRVK
ncbi:signal peptidase I [Fimbriimonas ginsengisoli]|nr:signal peptidase I [Fimbriimonas ginsengisoli]